MCGMLSRRRTRASRRSASTGSSACRLRRGRRARSRPDPGSGASARDPRSSPQEVWQRVPAWLPCSHRRCTATSSNSWSRRTSATRCSSTVDAHDPSSLRHPARRTWRPSAIICGTRLRQGGESAVRPRLRSPDRHPVGHGNPGPRTRAKSESACHRASEGSRRAGRERCPTAHAAGCLGVAGAAL